MDDLEKLEDQRERFPDGEPVELAEEDAPEEERQPSRFARAMGRLWERRAVIFSRLAFTAGPWLCLWMVETLNERTVIHDLNVTQLILNMVWYYAVFILCRVVLGRNRRAAATATVFFFGAGLVNHYILRFRGRILFPADVFSWRAAVNVAGGYDFSMDAYMWKAGAIFVAYLIILAFCAPQKKRAKLPLYMTLGFPAALVVYCFAFFGTGMLSTLHIYTQQWNTQVNGFVLNFTTAMSYTRVSKPSGYSRDAILALAEEYPGTEGDASIRPDKLIVIMNESLGDFSIYENFDASRDPLSFLHSMEENTIKGYMYSPVMGGGTATVEFEYLTGFTSLFQPPHSVAYQLYLYEGMPSLAAVAGEAGYETTAFHPYDRSGWNRVIAYERLSFDGQLYQEDVEDPYYVRWYVSDRSSYQTILNTIASQDRSFFFNVTMQNHGGYSQTWNNLRRTVVLSDALKEADAKAEQYFALAWESDQALKSLITQCEAMEERVMVVVFGDHQPSLKDAFYEELYGKALSELTTEENLLRYATPFFIWANYDIEEQQDVICSPSTLGVLTAKAAGLPTTPFMEFLYSFWQELPAITPGGFITANGETVTKEELSPAQKELYEQYELLNYGGLKDLSDETRFVYCLD